MSMKVRINLDPTDAILLRRGLDEGGEVQQFFTSEVARHCDPYVPMDTGTLKDSAQIYDDHVDFVQPYADKQYRENKGKGLRGKLWEKRMWSDRGDEIVTATAKKSGGKAK